MSLKSTSGYKPQKRGTFSKTSPAKVSVPADTFLSAKAEPGVKKVLVPEASWRTRTNKGRRR